MVSVYYFLRKIAMPPEIIVAFLGLLGVGATAILSYRGGSSAAKELTETAVQQVREFRVDISGLKDELEKERQKRRDLEKRVDEQDLLIGEILREREQLRAEKETLQRKIVALEARLTGVEESGEIHIKRDGRHE